METITIDTLGDVQLVVNNDNEQIGYIANSVVLPLASPVFAALVGPKFAEGKAILERENKKEVPVDVHLHDDDFEALEILLNITHLRPTCKPGLEGLIQLAVVLDKYQAAASVQTQTGIWMEDHLQQAAFSGRLPEYLGLAVVFGASQVYNMVAVGVALTTPWRNWADCRQDELMDRIGKTALVHKVPEKAVTGIRELITVYVQEIQTSLVAATHSIVRKQADGAQTATVGHSKGNFCTHDEETLAAWHSNVIQLGLLTPEGLSPMQLLYAICRLAQKTKSSSTGTHGPCTACHFVRCIDLDLDCSVRAILAARTGPTLQDLEHGSDNLDWRQIRSPGPCAQDNMFAEYSYQVLWLFGHVLGCRFLEGPVDWAGNEDSFEWCMGQALKEAAAVTKEGE